MPESCLTRNQELLDTEDATNRQRRSKELSIITPLIKVLTITTNQKVDEGKFIENWVIRIKIGNLCRVQLIIRSRDGKWTTEYKNHPMAGPTPIFRITPTEKSAILLIRQEKRIKKEDRVCIRKNTMRGEREFTIIVQAIPINRSISISSRNQNIIKSLILGSKDKHTK